MCWNLTLGAQSYRICSMSPRKKAKRTVPFSGWMTQAEARLVRRHALPMESVGQTIRRLALDLARLRRSDPRPPSSEVTE